MVNSDTQWYTSMKFANLNQLGFSYFEFKIRLIRLGLSFSKNKKSCIWTHNLLILSQ